MMEIIWGEKAKQSYFDELDRIYKLHSSKEVENFIILVDKIIYNLSTNLLQGKISKSTKINSFVISKQTTLYFDINKEKSRIELLLFWRNKEDPKKLSKLLKDI
ncbi:hypothetical protein [Polaribacter sp. 20A6]|uniref:hypothetical protein n=1 Tax=Polaribacter sp. 20A6 TaxID=2687289 RepID=UPI001F10E5E0|nr:hypothetical protein [Polaribacter sp. 20A6]